MRLNRKMRLSITAIFASGTDLLFRVAVVAILFGTALSGIARPQTTVEVANVQAEKTALPSWLKSGTIRFARFDGGPLETQKTLRSDWASRYSAQDREILANLYGTHADRMIELLVQAKVNFVWVTYSVGFSLQDEHTQRLAVREVVKKLHAHGIKVAAYMCATTVFWESLFKDEPQSVKWIMTGSDGVPYRYSGGRDVMRFVADVNNPGWIEYQKRRVNEIIDDGLDAIFFDNPNLDDHPNEATSVYHFFDQLLDYARREKKSSIPFFTNLGLQPQFNLLNHQMDFIFTEGWAEPGAWGDQWEVSNIRRDRLVRGLNPGLKPIVSEYSHFHKGDRNDSFLNARSVRLAIAEAAAFGTSYTWDMEGPLDTALIRQDAKAQETWAAIGQYDGFLAAHPELYSDAVNVVPWMVLLPDTLDPEFDWPGGATRLDFLAKYSVMGDFKYASRVSAKDLSAYQGVIVPSYRSLSTKQQEMIREYQQGGGRVATFAESPNSTGIDGKILPPDETKKSKDKSAEAQAAAGVNSLAPEATHVELENSERHILANITKANEGRALVIHLLNYDQAPAEELKLTLVVGKDFQKLSGRKPVLLSPDTAGATLREAQWKGSTLSATVRSLDSYSVLVLQ